MLKKKERLKNKNKYKTTYKSYREYLNSNRWKELVAKYKKKNCEICFNSMNLHLHHFDYDCITNEGEDDLATLCKDCHLAGHIGLVTKRKLIKPSRALRRIVMKIRNRKKIERNPFALFLRRRDIGLNGNENKKDMNHYRKLADKLIEQHE